MPERITRSFLERPTDVVARDLIGCVLHFRTDEGYCAGRIVETEAYGGPSDPASHSAMYRSERVKIMRRDAGLVYVYRSYGVHACFNVVAKPPGATGAVLMRAVEPTQGLELMAQRRGTEKRQLLCSGPGRLCQAFGIGLDDHGRDITEDADFWLEGREAEPVVMAGPRVGITRAVDLPWRFFEADSPFVSHRRVGRRTLVSEAAS